MSVDGGIPWPDTRAGTLEQLLDRVFTWASGIFTWTADIETWGVPEFWPTREDLEILWKRDGGAIHEDCDGFAMLCRCALWDMDIGTRLLVCNVEPAAAAPQLDGNHCVITAERTGLVLDCRQSRVVSREELERIGYRWVAMSGLNPGDPWTEVKT